MSNLMNFNTRQNNLRISNLLYMFVYLVAYPQKVKRRQEVFGVADLFIRYLISIQPAPPTSIPDLRLKVSRYEGHDLTGLTTLSKIMFSMLSVFSKVRCSRAT